MVTPTSDTTFDWYVNLNGTADVKATFTAEGRKKSCIIKLEEIEKISSVHRKENEDNAHLIKNPIVFAFLHKLPEDLQTSLMQHYAAQFDPKIPVLCYCNRCYECLRMGGATAVHLLDIAFSEM